jgi:myo-inositol-hexaphosphate 3-phosphohydrolase
LDLIVGDRDGADVVGFNVGWGVTVGDRDGADVVGIDVGFDVGWGVTVGDRDGADVGTSEVSRLPVMASAHV